MATTKPSPPPCWRSLDARLRVLRIASAAGLVVACAAAGCSGASSPPPDRHDTNVVDGEDGRKDHESGRSSVKLAEGCPTTVPAQASVCAAEDLVCDFTVMKSCRCELSSCITPAGPIPGCTPTPGWRCRDDGCPWDMREACSNEGKRCTQDDGMCAYDYECKGGAWKQSGGPGCRP